MCFVCCASCYTPCCFNLHLHLQFHFPLQPIFFSLLFPYHHLLKFHFLLMYVDNFSCLSFCFQVHSALLLCVVALLVRPFVVCSCPLLYESSECIPFVHLPRLLVFPSESFSIRYCIVLSLDSSSRFMISPSFAYAMAVSSGLFVAIRSFTSDKFIFASDTCISCFASVTMLSQIQN